MFKCYFRKEANILEQQGNAKGIQTSQDQILSEGIYADQQFQALYDEQILSLCHKAALNNRNRIQELGKCIESFIRVK